MSVILFLMCGIGYFVTKDVAWLFAAGLFNIAMSVDKISMNK